MTYREDGEDFKDTFEKK